MEAIGCALVEGRVLDVLAYDPGALLVAAAEQIGAAAMVMIVLVVVLML
jgi:hypothetical protein